MSGLKSFSALRGWLGSWTQVVPFLDLTIAPKWQPAQVVADLKEQLQQMSKLAQEALVWAQQHQGGVTEK